MLVLIVLCLWSAFEIPGAQAQVKKLPPSANDKVPPDESDREAQQRVLQSLRRALRALEYRRIQIYEGPERHPAPFDLESS
jgi:hypothetical protein